MRYYVYVLRCENDSLYTGITTDLDRRFLEHAGALAGGAKYTASRHPVRFECAFTAHDRASASRLEARIKQLTRAEKLALIAGKPPEKLNLTSHTRCVVTSTGKGAALRLYYDGRSSTCRRAKQFLDERGADYELLPKQDHKPGPKLEGEGVSLSGFREAEWLAVLCR